MTKTSFFINGFLANIEGQIAQDNSGTDEVQDWRIELQNSRNGFSTIGTVESGLLYKRLQRGQESLGVMKIIIIGASSGIGREMALRYAEEGHTVGATGRRAGLLEELKTAAPQNIFTASFDVTGGENLLHIQRLIAGLGGLDLLIYNAGFGHPSDDLLPQIEKSTTETLVTGFVDVITFAFAFFVQQGYGQLAVTSSVAGLRGNGLAPAYSAGKAFASNYAEGLNIKAHRLKKNIVMTDVRPGFIKTKMAKGSLQFWAASPQKAARQIMAAIRTRRRVVYVTRRWWIVAQLFKVLPYWLYKRLG